MKNFQILRYSLVSLIVLSLFLFVSCEEKANNAETIENDKPTQFDSSKKGVVATAHPLATEAGLSMLEKGGNAADAAVASAFVLSVVEPSMSGIGGRLQAIVRTPEGEIEGIDASTEAPMSYDPAKAAAYGYPVIGIPGVVAGLGKLHEDHGSLSWSEVVAPAVKLASEGFAILPGEARRHKYAIKEINEFDGTKQYFLTEEDSTYKAGELVVQKDLARTLTIIQVEGAEAFYSGEIAEMISEDITANGGYVTLESLASYKAKSSKIVKGSYRGYDLYGLWLPSFGAISIEALQILENFNVSEFNEGQWASAIYQSMLLSYNDRVNQLTDPSAIERLVSKQHADSLSMLIIVDQPIEDQELVGEAVNKDGHTTHLSVADASGMTVALTQSLGPNMGSKVAAPGLGFLYASTMGSYLGDFSPLPGKRAVSHISPFIVEKDGQPFLTLGAAGGSRIVTAIVQVVSRVIDFGMPLDEALAAPRVHPGDEAVLVEIHEGINWNAEDMAFLTSMGFELDEQDQKARFGRVHAVMFDSETGTWYGAADPDWEGTSRGVK